MKEFIKYEELFNEIIDAVFYPYSGRYFASSRKDINNLAKEVASYLCRKDDCFSLERDDLEQQLRYLWIRFIQTYKKTRPKVHIKTYLTRRSVWALRDWLKKEAKVLRRGPLSSTKIDPIEPQPLPLKLLLMESSIVPSYLTPFQKSLIFLKVYGDKNILQISELMNMEQHAISNHYCKLLLKLKRRIKDEENLSGRLCQRRS